MRAPALLLLPFIAQAATLRILPPSATLEGPESYQQLLAQSQQDDTPAAHWTSSNPSVATVDKAGVVRPVADGEATITAASEGQTASITVHVNNAHAPHTWSFRNDVIPVMSKVGCNSGACHGAAAGKNGFKLTLRGYDPDEDYATLTRQSDGRRVSLSDPAHSLMLLKPTFAVPHGGGKRFATDSLEYRVIAEWIAAGAPRPQDGDPTVTALEVFPASITLQAGAEQQLVVRAKYSDGRLRDVTRWVRFGSSDESVASVDDNGHVKMNGSGEAAITLWYASRVLYARLGVPYANKVDPEVYTKFQRHNYIDDLVLAKLKALNIAPSGPAADSSFIRRAYLDAAGILPTSEEVEDFLADQSADKRSKLIDRLLERDEYVDYWAYKWSDLMLISSRKLRANAMWAFYDWIRDSVKDNKPWNKFAYEIFTSSGDTRQNGALNYYVLHKDPIDLTETATEAFMGNRVTCARCHNHPLEKWTQKQYYELVNLFARVGLKNGNEPGDIVVYAKDTGDVLHPKLLKPLPPTPLDGTPMSLDSTEDRRVHFADWLVSPKNTYFSRALVNRVWANFMGRGLVESVDDVRATNPASNEELFAALSDDFVKSGYDVKRLIRAIMNSGVYQLSADSNAENQMDTKYYSRYFVKRLPAEVLLDAMSQVTGVPTKFGGYPVGTRALQLPDVQVQSQFLSAFGRPKRIICDAGERSGEPNIAQALHVINGDTLNKKLSDSEGYAALAVKLGLSDSRILDHLYLSAFSRYPGEAEKQPLLEALRKARASTGSPDVQREAHRQALEDMMWAMLTSKEFLFNY
ncbi:MAG: DUF1549 domain-containing protein [Bryobacteraceae bacterium]|jgi:uncharacterized protein DUF1549/uncharacterized protein DUF1553/Big-like domain-containing protein